jgi:hypothetical protein
MKVMFKYSSVFVFLTILVSCATTSIILPEKYNLDKEFEAVERINTIKAPSLEKVDNQSVLLKANWNEYYLLILRRSIDTRFSEPSIGISRTLSGITSGIDRVSVKPSEGTETYVIEKIYKLKGKEQAKEIKERFGNS